MFAGGTLSVLVSGPGEKFVTVGGKFVMGGGMSDVAGGEEFVGSVPFNA
jgi:hypothetical protein